MLIFKLLCQCFGFSTVIVSVSRKSPNISLEQDLLEVAWVPMEKPSTEPTAMPKMQKLDVKYTDTTGKHGKDETAIIPVLLGRCFSEVPLICRSLFRGIGVSCGASDVVWCRMWLMIPEFGGEHPIRNYTLAWACLVNFLRANIGEQLHRFQSLQNCRRVFSFPPKVGC